MKKETIINSDGVVIDDRQKYFIHKALLDSGIPSEVVFGSEQGVEQGVGITNKAIPSKTYDSKLSTDVLTASKVSHAFRFVVNINPCEKWKNRRMICESKGLNVQLKGGIGQVFMTSFKGFKIWLGDKSITIYFPEWKKYYVEEARFGFNYALEDLKIYLNDLSLFLDMDLSWEGIYKFKVTGQHHALIHNSLAKMYNHNKEKLNVYDKNGELWLVIDNSRRESIRMNDIETIGKTSDRNMDNVVDPFFNQLKETSLMPKDILTMFKITNDNMNRLIERDEYHAENIKSHVIAIKEMAFMLKLINRRGGFNG